MSDGSGDEAWDDWREEDGAGAPVRCLFSEQVFPNAEACLASARQQHGLDLLALRDANGLDQYGCMRLVNFVRTRVSEGVVAGELLPLKELPTGDEWLKPVLDNDALLTYDYEGDGDFSDSDGGDESSPTRGEAGPAAPGAVDGGKALLDRLAATVGDPGLGDGDKLQESLRVSQGLAEELFRAQQAFAAYKERAESLMLGGTSAEELRTDAEEHDAREATETGSQRELDSYFASYSHYGIHEEMLKDRVRTESYRDFMYKNPDLFAGKVVLDVGCGTGILSMFAARAGAKLVIGVDNSDVIDNARAIVMENGLEDKVTLIRGKVEEIELPVEHVDIIVSEWMGYCLLFESMLDTVLWARDKWLAPGGVVHPDQSSMYLAAINQDRLAFWDDVYGFQMTSMKRPVIDEATIAVMDMKHIVSAPCVIKDLNMMDVAVKELEFEVPFTVVLKASTRLTGFCVHFDVLFEAGCSVPTVFSTGPEATPTHWKQTLFYLEHPADVNSGDTITGRFALKRRRENQRSLQVTITHQITPCQGGQPGPESTQSFAV